MRLALKYLQKLLPSLSSGLGELRVVCDDVGLEVKRVEEGDDPKFTFELLANRGDHHSYWGIARELYGRLGGELVFPAVEKLSVVRSQLPFDVKTTNCLSFSLTYLFLDNPMAALPKDVGHVLDAEGINGTHLAVDVTNFVNLELGQPLHAYDADKIAGRIVVRESLAGERALPLFATEPVELPVGTIVIADDQNILAIAGVIGCQSAMVTSESRHIALESALFDPVAVRKASRHLKIVTHASKRFERGGDRSMVIPAVARAVQLMGQATSLSRLECFAFGDSLDSQKVIFLDLDAASFYFSTDIATADAVDRLRRYGFGVAVKTKDDSINQRKLNVTVPAHRVWDVVNCQDLYEELGRSIGYNSFPDTLPPSLAGEAATPAEEVEQLVADVLVANGFFEIFTDGFYGRGVREKLGLSPESPLWDHIETVNAQDRTYAFLKNNCLAQAVEVVKQNLNFKTNAIKAFEWTRIFKPLRGSTETFRMEQKKVWAIASGPVSPSRWQTKPVDADIFYCKGIVQQVSDVLGLDVEFSSSESHPLEELLHPLRHLKLLSRGKVIGIVGEVHPQICQSHGIKGARPYYFEFDYDALLLLPRGELVVVEPPELPPVERSLAVSFPVGRTTQIVREFIRNTAPNWLLDVRQVDEFVLEKDGQKLRSITFDFTFQQDGSRSAEDINQCLMNVAKSINDTFGDQGITIR